MFLTSPSGRCSRPSPHPCFPPPSESRRWPGRSYEERTSLLNITIKTFNIVVILVVLPDKERVHAGQTWHLVGPALSRKKEKKEEEFYSDPSFSSFCFAYGNASSSCHLTSPATLASIMMPFSSTSRMGSRSDSTQSTSSRPWRNEKINMMQSSLHCGKGVQDSCIVLIVTFTTTPGNHFFFGGGVRIIGASVLACSST